MYFKQFLIENTVDDLWKDLESRASRGRLTADDLAPLADALMEAGDPAGEVIAWMYQNNVFPHSVHNIEYGWASDRHITPYGLTPSQPRESNHEPWILPQSSIDKMCRMSPAGKVWRYSQTVSDITFNTFKEAVMAFVDLKETTLPGQTTPPDKENNLIYWAEQAIHNAKINLFNDFAMNNINMTLSRMKKLKSGYILPLRALLNAFSSINSHDEEMERDRINIIKNIRRLLHV